MTLLQGSFIDLASAAEIWRRPICKLAIMKLRRSGEDVWQSFLDASIETAEKKWYSSEHRKMDRGPHKMTGESSQTMFVNPYSSSSKFLILNSRTVTERFS